MRQDEIEINWLREARDVISAGRGECSCPVAATDLRWPGYIGGNYAVGRVLFVGAIYNSNKLFTEDIERLSTVARSWRDGGVSDRDYLAAVRTHYPPSIEEWSKNSVWGVFDEIRMAFDLEWEQIAFTNLSKCHAPSLARSGKTGLTAEVINAAIVNCTRRFPLDRLIEGIDPLAVFIAKDHSDVRDSIVLRREGNPKYVVRRYSNHGTARSGGLSKYEWMAQDTARYFELKGELLERPEN